MFCDTIYFKIYLNVHLNDDYENNSDFPYSAPFENSLGNVSGSEKIPYLSYAGFDVNVDPLISNVVGSKCDPSDPVS